MQWLSGLGRRLLMLVWRRRFDYDLEEEIRLHLELREQEKREAGLMPDEARYAARRQFGNPTQLREASHDMWGWQTLETLLQDLSYGVRQLRRNRNLHEAAPLPCCPGR